MEIKGYGRQSGQKEIYRGAEYVVNFVPKIKIDIAVSANQVDQVIETIQALFYICTILSRPVFLAS